MAFAMVVNAGTIHLKFEISDENNYIHLICVKSKIAPFQRISIPRLELCGALL